MLDERYLLDPGALFDAERKPCTLMRINFAATQEATFWTKYSQLVRKMRAEPGCADATQSISSGASGPSTSTSSLSFALASGSLLASLKGAPGGARQRSEPPASSSR